MPYQDPMKPGDTRTSQVLLCSVTHHLLPPHLPLQEDKIPATPVAGDGQTVSGSGASTSAPTEGGSMPRSVSSLQRRRHTVDHTTTSSPNSSGKELLSPDSTKKASHGLTGARRSASTLSSAMSSTDLGRLSLAARHDTVLPT
jgi:hypothetical protein